MATLINKYISECYIKQTQPKLPVKLESKENTYNQLATSYIAEVQHRGKKLIDDYSLNLQKVTDWLHKSEMRGLLLTGTLGNGKTTTLAAIKKVIGLKARKVEANEIYDLCKANNGEIPYLNEPVLLLDDLGTEPIRCLIYGDEYLPIVKLISHRYRYLLPTIIATNLRMDEIEARYGSRVADRMVEEYDAIEYTRASYRSRD